MMPFRSSQFPFNFNRAKSLSAALLVLTMALTSCKNNPDSTARSSSAENAASGNDSGESLSGERDSGVTLADARGADSSGGSDLLGPDEGAAWFVGEGKKIRVCYEVSPNFSAPSTVAPGQLISRAFSAWKNYFRLKTTYEDFPEGFTKGPLAPVFDPIIRQATVGGCLDSDTDLTIYFGVENARVKSVRAAHVDPFAFAKRTRYSMHDGWGKGFVWLAATPDSKAWPDEIALYGELLHELGHVEGCEHVSGTIMDENLAQVVFPEARPDLTASDREVLLTKIDQSHELIVNTKWDYSAFKSSQEVLQGWSRDARFSSQVQTLFQRLMGRENEGEISLQLTGYVDYGVTLILSDSKGSAQFHIPYNATQAAYYTNIRAFYRIRDGVDNEGKPQNQWLWENAARPQSFSGTLKTSEGPGYLVSITWNASPNSAKTSSDQRNWDGFAPMSIVFTDLSVEVNAVFAVYLRPSQWQ